MQSTISDSTIKNLLIQGDIKKKEIMAKEKSRSEESMFVTLLTVLFIGLKLTNQIDWSWWWVLSPLWISAALVIGILLIVLLISYFTR